jgi:HlyD family secretion protein
MHYKKWLIFRLFLSITIILGGGIYFIHPDWLPAGWGVTPPETFADGGPVEGDTTLPEMEAVPRQVIRPAAEVMAIKATGSIALQEQEIVLAKVKALITALHVKLGDTVAAGDILVELDTQNLQRELEEARFNLQKAQSELKKLTDPPEADKVAVAKQKLLIAQEELAKVKAGPGAVELQAAEAEVFVAWAKYNELAAGKTDDELATERIALEQAERTLKRAQEDYDSISWRSNFEIAEERAKTLETATTAYETAKAAYNKSVKPAEEKDLRSAQSEALKAQEKLDELRQKPTPKDLAEAELKELEARQELDKLIGPPDPDKLAEAKMEVQKKELLVAEAEATLANAKLVAPFAGTVVNIEAQAGKTAEVNDKMVTVANLQAFKLTVNVPETKINRLHQGQTATISLDALPTQVFSGTVSYISPLNQGDNNGVVSYAVTVALDLKETAGIRSGMTANVNFVDETMTDAWLVPTIALQPADQGTTVTVYRDNQPLTLPVEPGLLKGEWTVVHAPGLQEGDEVEAQLSSFLDEGETHLA